MVDILRAAAADIAVNAPVSIEGEDIVERTLRATLCLSPADFLAGILNDLASGGNKFFRENAPAMNLGRGNSQFESAKARVEFRLRAFAGRSFQFRFQAL